MSISYCIPCDCYVDWDVDVEHHDNDGKCVKQQVDALIEQGFDVDEVYDALADMNLFYEPAI